MLWKECFYRQLSCCSSGAPLIGRVLTTLQILDPSELQYNPLLDPHLKDHFTRKVWIKPIQEQGLVTEDNKVLNNSKEVGCFI